MISWLVGCLWRSLAVGLAVGIVFSCLKKLVVHQVDVGVVTTPLDSDDNENARLVAVDLNRMDRDPLPLPPPSYFEMGTGESAHMPVSIVYHRRCGLPVSLLMTVTAVVFLLWLGGASRKCASFRIVQI